MWRFKSSQLANPFYFAWKLLACSIVNPPFCWIATTSIGYQIMITSQSPRLLFLHKYHLSDPNSPKYIPLTKLEGYFILKYEIPVLGSLFLQPISTTSQTPSISLHASTYQPFAGFAIPNWFPFCSLQPSSSLSSSHPLHDPCQFPLFPLTTLDSSIPNSLCASTTFPNHLRMAPMGPRLQTWKSRHSPSYPTLFTPSSISLTSMPVASMTSQSRLSSSSSLISDHMSIPAVSPQPLALSVFGLDSFSSAVKGSALISSTVPNPNSAISFKSQVSESSKSHWLFAGPSFNQSPFILSSSCSTLISLRLLSSLCCHWKCHHLGLQYRARPWSCR